MITISKQASHFPYVLMMTLGLEVKDLTFIRAVEACGVHYHCKEGGMGWGDI